MYEQRRHFVRVVEDEAVAPRDDRTGERPMRETVACDKERSIVRKEPDVDEVEDGAVVAEIEEEVVPRTFLVVPRADGEKVASL